MYTLKNADHHVCIGIYLICQACASFDRPRLFEESAGRAHSSLAERATPKLEIPASPGTKTPQKMLLTYETQKKKQRRKSEQNRTAVVLLPSPLNLPPTSRTPRSKQANQRCAKPCLCLLPPHSPIQRPPPSPPLYHRTPISSSITHTPSHGRGFTQ